MFPRFTIRGMMMAAALIRTPSAAASIPIVMRSVFPGLRIVVLPGQVPPAGERLTVVPGGWR